MKIELQEKLITDFPKIYQKITDDKSLMKFGFECKDGWFDLIYKLSSTIQELLDFKDYKNRTAGIQIIAFQVKEKMGSLHFYYDTEKLKVKTSKKLKQIVEYQVTGAVRLAEKLSSKICEYCGNKATKQTKPWTRNLCEECYDKEERSNI